MQRPLIPSPPDSANLFSAISVALNLLVFFCYHILEFGYKIVQWWSYELSGTNHNENYISQLFGQVQVFLSFARVGLFILLLYGTVSPTIMLCYVEGEWVTISGLSLVFFLLYWDDCPILEGLLELPTRYTRQVSMSSGLLSWTHFCAIT